MDACIPSTWLDILQDFNHTDHVLIQYITTHRHSKPARESIQMSRSIEFANESSNNNSRPMNQREREREKYFLHYHHHMIFRNTFLRVNHPIRNDSPTG